jgi:hypothetical protein
MRLDEFDDEDRLSHKTKDKKNRTIEQRLSDIKDDILTVESNYNTYVQHKIGRKTFIKSTLSNIIDDISEFYDFCNIDSKDDTETRKYMIELKELYTKVSTMFDSI